MTTYFCSDLHLGHKRVAEFRKEVSSCGDNTTRILSELSSTLTKRDWLIVLGDWCFDMELVESFNNINCDKKFLVRGNHDQFQMEVYNKVFDGIAGLWKYKSFWLSHAPIHLQELRGKKNLHGHVHYNSVPDNNYFNCCPEALWPKYGRCLVSLDEVRKHFEYIN